MPSTIHRGDRAPRSQIVFTQWQATLVRQTMHEDLLGTLQRLEHLHTQLEPLTLAQSNSDSPLCQRQVASMLRSASVAAQHQTDRLHTQLRLFASRRAAALRHNRDGYCDDVFADIVRRNAQLINLRLFWLRFGNPVEFNTAFLANPAQFAAHAGAQGRMAVLDVGVQWQTYREWCTTARANVAAYIILLVRQAADFCALQKRRGVGAFVRSSARTRQIETQDAIAALHEVHTRLTAQISRIEGQRPALIAGLAHGGVQSNAEDPAICMEMVRLMDTLMNLPGVDMADDNQTFLSDQHLASFDSCDASGRSRGRGGRGSRGGGAGGAGLSGVMADESGRPEGYASAAAAMNGASWETQARFFKFGAPIAHDINHRRFALGNSGYVDIQAYQPQKYYSTRSNGTQTGIALGVGALGLVSGLMAAMGPLGAGALATVGAGASTLNSAFNAPQDATWQPYTATYYSAPEAAALGSWDFYGCMQSANMWEAVKVEGETDPARFINFADAPELFTWSRWMGSWSAQHRAPQWTEVGRIWQAQEAQRASLQAPLTPELTAKLVEAMAQLVPTSGPRTVLISEAARLALPALNGAGTPLLTGGQNPAGAH